MNDKNFEELNKNDIWEFINFFIKVKLEFPKNFPVSRPNITFVSKMYHPLIDLNGKLDN